MGAPYDVLVGDHDLLGGARMQLGEPVCSIAEVGGSTGVHMPQHGLTVVDDGCCGCVARGLVVEDSDEVRELSGS